MPYLEANGLRFHYADDNFTDPWTDPEIVFIQHGWGRSSKFFYHWVPGLVRDYRVLRRDMRGHGLSEVGPPPDTWSIDDLIEDMRLFLDELGISAVHYVGESAGGVFGAAFAAKYPERVRSLTLMSSPLSDPTRNPAHYGNTDLATTVLTTPLDTFVKILIAGRGVVAISPEHEKWMIEEWSKNRPEVLAAIARLFPQVDLAPLVKGLPVPTLILAPANSFTAPLDDQKRMHDLIPNSRLEVIEGSGHELFFERFEECFAAVRSFLSSVEKAP